MFFKISWSKAVWLEGNIEEVGTVPTLWIENEYIRWPVGVNALRTMAEQKMEIIPISESSTVIR